MKTRLSLALGLLLAISPASVAAQADASPVPGAADSELVSQLCSAATSDQAKLDSCIGSVEVALTQMLEGVSEEDMDILARAQALVDDTITDLRDIDIEQALDDAVASAQAFELDVDVQAAIDDAVAAIEEFEVDVQAALDEAVAEALAATEDFDLQAAVDTALAEAQAAIEEADVQGTVDDAVAALEESVAEARAVVAEAQRWAQENCDAVCRGGSISLGTTVGVAVFALTGVEWLGLQAFWATERLTNGICGDVVQ